MNRRLLGILRATRFWCSACGLDPIAAFRTARGLPRYLRDLRTLMRQRNGDTSAWPISISAPCLSDWSQPGGTASGQYFHQDLLVAQRIFERGAEKHVDVGSRVDGFVAHVASFRAIEVFDIRESQSQVRNIEFRSFDLMQLPAGFDEYCDSLSCLHALEHFGLGRYGDPIQYHGYRAGLQNLVRLLRPGGILYLSVPIGPQRIEFNGHRVFSVTTILDLAKPLLELLNISYVDDDGVLHENAAPERERLERSFDVHYGCAIFEFRKPERAALS